MFGGSKAFTRAVVWALFGLLMLIACLKQSQAIFFPNQVSFQRLCFLINKKSLHIPHNLQLFKFRFPEKQSMSFRLHKDKIDLKQTRKKRGLSLRKVVTRLRSKEEGYGGKVNENQLPLAVTPATTDTPEHLIVLVHGLEGTPEDLAYLSKVLTERAERTDKSVLVHCARANHRRTRDGVVRGGKRLASEIESVVKAYPSLKELSLVGNSLGGLYVRYAASLLQDNEDRPATPESEEAYSAKSPSRGTMAGGLIPNTFMTIATPHLGVRRFTYIALPDFVHPLADVAVGQTGKDLFLRDSKTDPLLLKMASTPEFLGPLLQFQRRRAYANVKGDFMVPFGTAAFAPTGGSFDEIVLPSNPSQQRSLNLVPFKRRGNFAPFGRRQKEKIIWEYRTKRSFDYKRQVPEVGDIGRKGRNLEVVMAENLDSCGWSKVGVDFGGLLPFSHNMICALSRNQMTTKIFKTGQPVMDHAAEYILSETM
mmetsp:Transcript_8450/g.11000  ORF Transcript_8450/g.11000 Transcript_8450/m.11000 type:complete len:480 (-) Transcript_8450:331-1770(-)